jgi:2,3-diketo-5-methylthio-1-phosphopentane phosphatase
MRVAPVIVPVFAQLDPGGTLSDWIVLCDFDGTVSLEDVTDSLLLRFGRPGWDVLEADWREGRIGSLECMAGQVALLDCSPDELEEHLAAIEIDPHFAAFAEEVARLGWPMTILSDGLDHAITSILARNQLGHLNVVANRLERVGARRWRLSFPHARAGCASGTCKCAFARRGGPRVLLIGDGASDFCVASRADLTLARKRLLEHCLDRHLPHRPVSNFKQALALLPSLRELTRAPEDDLHE